jgi:antibiotic biosynthesis monooxygenase (ABM) superfamily enzyme
MVLYVQKYDIDPAKAADYIDWAKSAIPRILSVPGVVEFRGYRPAAGDSQIAVTYEFADMVSWAEWQASETIQQVLVEARTYMINFSTELWGPSPVVPDPIRPGS